MTTRSIRKMRTLNVAVVGAGLGGLCAAKHAKSSGHTVTIFEQCAELGGTWIYTDKTGVDEYGLNIHTSMYHNLRTNLPKEIMGFTDYPMPQSPRSYITSNEVLSYLISFAEHFKLNELIRFRHQVIRVRPIDVTKWEVTVKDLPSNKVQTTTFDVIFVSNGHSSVPFTPHYDGIDKFLGRYIHSHDYRRADAYKDRRVLTIGAGPSGVDLTHALSEFAEAVYFSHHTHNLNHTYPSNVHRVGSVQRFTENSVIFMDGTNAEITDIVFCTGYNYTFPFLDADCGLHIDENYVYPLYKQCINAEHPTMAIIGYVFSSPITHMIDLQVRFALQFFNGNVAFPSRDEMIADSQAELRKRLALGWPKRKGHSIAGELRQEYFSELSTIANIENVPEILMKIYEDGQMRRSIDPKGYRNDVYTIIDDEHFQRTTLTSN